MKERKRKRRAEMGEKIIVYIIIEAEERRRRFD